MPQINNFPIMRTYKHTPRQAVESTVPPEKKLSYTSKAVIGTGAVALAATGIYLVSRGKNQNIDNVFKQLQNSDTFMPILSNTKLKAKEFKNLMFKLTKDETDDDFPIPGATTPVIKITADPTKAAEDVFNTGSGSYYCEVTNHANNSSASIDSDEISVIPY